VGGCDITIEMYKNGELKQLLAEAGAVPALRPAGSRRPRIGRRQGSRSMGSSGVKDSPAVEGSTSSGPIRGQAPAAGVEHPLN